jgi:hypothetical protein
MIFLMHEHTHVVLYLGCFTSKIIARCCVICYSFALLYTFVKSTTGYASLLFWPSCLFLLSFLSNEQTQDGEDELMWQNQRILKCG